MKRFGFTVYGLRTRVQLLSLRNTLLVLQYITVEGHWGLGLRVSCLGFTYGLCFKFRVLGFGVCTLKASGARLYALGSRLRV